MLRRPFSWLLLLLAPIFTVHCAEDGLNAIDLICESPKDCDDGNPCTVEQCVPMVECRNILVEDGQICDENGVAICIDGVCDESQCGDLYIDPTLGEECDDGNTLDNDGCASDCTNGGPTITIAYPPRGATLDGDTTVTVLGELADPKVGMESFTINGESVSVNADGSFAHPIVAKHGLNLVEAKALSLGGKTDLATVGFYHSSAYLPFAEIETETSPIANGFIYRLGQDAFDDGDHPCATVEGRYECDEVDDLATIGEIILNNLSADGFEPFFDESLPFVREALSIGPEVIQLGDLGSLTLNGEIGFEGDVAIATEVVELDFNDLGLSLDARDGGLDAAIDISTSGETPGFTITLRTSVAVNAAARFNEVSLVLDTGLGFPIESMALICPLLSASGLLDSMVIDTICPGAQGTLLAPLAGFEPSPTAWADSSVTIAQMTLETGFNISTDADGNINVALVDGSVEFHDSEINLAVIRDLQIDLGNLIVLGGIINLDLGQVDLSAIAEGLNTVLSAFPNLLLNDLQSVLEPAIELLLLNPNDPANVGDMLKRFILEMGVERDLEIANYSDSQPNTPSLHLQSKISLLEFAAPEPGDGNTGGMTAGFGTVVSAPKNINRTPLGMVLRDGCYGEQVDSVVFSEAEAMEAAQYLDALNQGIYAAWWDGGFNMGLTPADSQAPLPVDTEVSDYAIQLEFYTAPIFTSCTDGQTQLQVADAKIEGSYSQNGDEYTMVAFANFSMPVTWSYAEGGGVNFELATSEGRLFSLDVVSGTAAMHQESQIAPLMESAIAEQLVSRYVARVLTAYPTLSFDLAQMYDLELAQRLEMTPSSYYHSNGYEVIAGATD